MYDALFNLRQYFLLNVFPTGIYYCHTRCFCAALCLQQQATIPPKTQRNDSETQALWSQYVTGVTSHKVCADFLCLRSWYMLVKLDSLHLQWRFCIKIRILLEQSDQLTRGLTGLIFSSFQPSDKRNRKTYEREQLYIQKNGGTLEHLDQLGPFDTSSLKYIDGNW